MWAWFYHQRQFERSHGYTFERKDRLLTWVPDSLISPLVCTACMAEAVWPVGISSFMKVTKQIHVYVKKYAQNSSTSIDTFESV